MADFNTLNAPQVGQMLHGFGVNLLVKDVARTADFLQYVFQFRLERISWDYAILTHSEQIYQLHGDHTYSDHPLSDYLPESDLRGVGVELRLYDIDPDAAEQKARGADYVILQSTTDKPHGLRECYILDPDGYIWVPSKIIPKIVDDEQPVCKKI